MRNKTHILFQKVQFAVIDAWFFFIKELKSVIFAGSFLGLLFVSNYVSIPGLYRYDFLFIGAVLIQILLLVFKLETKDEAKNIILFHLIGLVLEIYKTHPSVGSWSYPEAGFFKILNVPLYSGFMYAAIGSYIASAWKNLKMKLEHAPSYPLLLCLAVMIYVNFFTNHFIQDMRYLVLFPLVVILYFKTKIYFTPHLRTYSMPVILGFFLTGLFVWFAENIATFYGAWKYPDQLATWNVVSFQKISSWFLMVIISFIIVCYLKHYKDVRKK
jgi:uncharacterized membrane protein YoaT (DUF817 family)